MLYLGMSTYSGLKNQCQSCFSQISIFGSIIGFHALTFARYLGDVKTLGDRSCCYRGKLNQSSYMDEACSPAFQCLNRCQYQAWDDNARTHLARISNISFVRIMVCALTGQSAHQTCLHLKMCRTFWTEDSTHTVELQWLEL